MAEKKPQILELDPPIEMVFKGPFTDVVTANLKLTNPTNDTVIFKVKTTAPKQYCVRPNSGVLKPHEDSNIAVMLQPFDPSSPESSKHKFMVQTMVAPADFVPEQLDHVWKNAPKSALMDSKLKCSFVLSEDGEMPEDQPPQVNDEPGSPENPELFKSIIPPTPPSSKADSPSESAPQSNAGNTPGAAKQTDVERAANESKIRVLQDKLERISTENIQLKGEASKLKQRLATTGGAAAGKIKPQITHSSSSLNLVAIMLILVAIILGYLVGKWL